MGSIGGQASGDFRLSQGALRILYSVIKDSIAVLASDGFTQSNPSVVTTGSARSTTLPTAVKSGVLGGSVAFTRPDVGENTVGGATLVGAAYVNETRPLGLFINDGVGNAFENTPGVASGKGPYLRGGSVGVKIYETQVQTTRGAAIGVAPASAGKSVGNAVGDDLTYAVGQKLYASVNGLLTNVWQDSYEAQWITVGNVGSGAGGDAVESDVTCLGTLMAPPDAASAEIFVSLAFIG